MDLCGPITETYLDADGFGSALTVHLKSSNYLNVCTLNVRAPETHVVNVQFVDVVPNIDNETSDNRDTRENFRCLLDVVSFHDVSRLFGRDKRNFQISVSARRREHGYVERRYLQ